MKRKIQKRWLLGSMVVLAFGSIISAVQIDSYRSDLNNLNPLWYILTIVFGVLALGFLYLATKTPKV